MRRSCQRGVPCSDFFRVNSIPPGALKIEEVFGRSSRPTCAKWLASHLVQVVRICINWMAEQGMNAQLSSVPRIMRSNHDDGRGIGVAPGDLSSEEWAVLEPLLPVQPTRCRGAAEPPAGHQRDLLGQTHRLAMAGPARTLRAVTPG